MNTKTNFTLEELLNKYKIEIPAIQRDYAFGRKDEENKREKFVQTIEKALLNNNEKLHLDFIYGKKDENGRLFLLDGQQRITTLWLVAVYLTKIAEMKNINEKHKIEVLNKFTYDTRTSSREFCEALLSEKWSPKNWPLKNKKDKDEKEDKKGLDEKWFFDDWRYDPTIIGMVTMLKAIHKGLFDSPIFKDKKEINIKELMSNIDFSFLDIEELGEPEELYLKMNSRGKQLADWDNFKAELFEFVDKNKSSNGDFKELVDTELVDLFFKIKNEMEMDNENQKVTENVDDQETIKNIEEGMLKFFKSAIRVEIIISGDFEVDKIDSDEKLNSEVEKNWEKYIDINSIQKFWKFLEKNENEIKKINFERFSKNGVRIKDLFVSLLGSDEKNMKADELSLFATYYLFVKKLVDEKKLNLDDIEDDFKQSVRIISNYQGKNERSDFSYAYRNIVDINNLIKKNDKSILKNVINDDKNNKKDDDIKAKMINDFGWESLIYNCENIINDDNEKDEIIKAKMINDFGWGNLIYNCENNPFSKGSAKWLIELGEKSKKIIKFGLYWSNLIGNFDNNLVNDSTKLLMNLFENDKKYPLKKAEKYYDVLLNENETLFDDSNNMDVEKEANLLSYIDIRNNYKNNGYFPKGNTAHRKVYSWWTFFKEANNNPELINGLKFFLDNQMEVNPELNNNDWRQWYLKAPTLLNIYKTFRFDFKNTGKDFVIKDQKAGNSTKYLLQLTALNEFYKEKHSNDKFGEIRSMGNVDRNADFYAYYIEKGKEETEKNYLYKIKHETIKESENPQFLILNSSDEEVFKSEGESVSEKLKQTSDKLEEFSNDSDK